MIPILLDEQAGREVLGYTRVELDSSKQLKRSFIPGHLNYRLGFYHLFSTINYLRLGVANYWNASNENKRHLIETNWNLNPPTAFLTSSPLQGLGAISAIVSKGTANGSNLAVIESVRISLPEFFGIKFPDLNELYSGEPAEFLASLENRENHWPALLLSKNGVLSKEKAGKFIDAMHGGRDSYAFIAALTAFFYADERKVGKALELLSIDVNGNFDVKIAEISQPIYVISGGDVAFTGSPKLNLFEDAWKQMQYCVSPKRFESGGDTGGG